MLIRPVQNLIQSSLFTHHFKFGNKFDWLRSTVIRNKAADVMLHASNSLQPQFWKIVTHHHAQI